MSGILGDYNWDNVFGSTALNKLAFVKCVAPISGEINTIKINSATTSANKMKCGVYADNAGVPGVFLEKTEEQSPNTGEMTFTLLSSVPVVAGTTYWLTVQRDVAFSVYYYVDNAQYRYRDTWTYDTWTDDPVTISLNIRPNMYALIESTDNFSTGWDTNWDNAVTHANPFQLLGVRFKASSSFDTTHLNCSLRKHATSGATECKIALYNDNAGAVGTLVNVTDAIPVVDDTVDDQTVTGEIAPSALVKDTYYWLILEANGNVRMRYTSSYYSWKRLHITSWTYDTFNDGPIGSPTNNGRVLLYATAEAPPVTINVEESLGFAETVEIDVSNETINVEEGLGFSEAVELDVSNETINVEESLGFAELVSLETSTVDTIDIFESLGFGDEEYLQINTIDVEESLGFAETIVLSNEEAVSGASKILSYNPLVIITDTDPVTLTEVDVSDPTTPTWNKWTINLPGETVTNAKDISYNSNLGLLYITCANGQLLEVDATAFGTREQIDLGTTNNLINTVAEPVNGSVYISTDKADGQIILLQDTEVGLLNTDIRINKQVSWTLQTALNTISAGILNLDLRIFSETENTFNCDLRILGTDYEAFDLIKRTDFHVYIDGVETDDVKLDSIEIRHLADEESEALFILGRKHDALNVSHTGVPSVITNQNAVTIYIKTKLEFSGKISSLTCNSQLENVSVQATGTVMTTQRNTISVPLSSIDTQLHPYDALLHNPVIYNPELDPDDENPPVHNGVEIDLGESETQSISRFTEFSNVTLQVINGTFNPKQNREYFWFCNLGNYVVGVHLPYSVYIGTSPASISGDTWVIISLTYKWQRQRDSVIHSLGTYRIGSAPYKSVSATNGVFRPHARWEDKPDGLYVTLDDSYNYTSYAIAIAQAEYNKMKNISGTIFPQTSCEVQLTVDGYLYYDPSILTRLNLSNTTTENIYNGNNGFPVSVKTITINSGSMTVSLGTDNALSEIELQEIEDAKPNESSSEREGYSRLNFSKFDVNGLSTVE